jgi:hypothetical protein
MLHVSVCLVALLETLSQEAHRATFHCHCNTPRRISSEAAPDVVRTEPLGVSPGEDEASYGSDCNAAAADDDEDEASYDSDGGLQYYMRGIVGHAMRARLTAKFKLLQDVEGLLDEAMRARLAGKFKLLHDRRLVVKDKLRRRASAPGLVVKRIAKGSQGHYPLQQAESCADQASSSDAAAAVESQAPSLPVIKIDAGFFKSYAQRIKKQREMLRCSSGL